MTIPDLYYYVGTDGRTYQGYMPEGASAPHHCWYRLLTRVCLEYLLPNDSVSPKSGIAMLLAFHEAEQIQTRPNKTDWVALHSNCARCGIGRIRANNSVCRLLSRDIPTHPR